MFKAKASKCGEKENWGRDEAVTEGASIAPGPVQPPPPAIAAQGFEIQVNFKIIKKKSFYPIVAQE